MDAAVAAVAEAEPVELPEDLVAMAELDKPDQMDY